MKCENCSHLTVCKYHDEILGNKNLNPYVFSETEEGARKAMTSFFMMFDNCKFFKERNKNE